MVLCSANVSLPRIKSSDPSPFCSPRQGFQSLLNTHSSWTAIVLGNRGGDLHAYCPGHCVKRSRRSQREVNTQVAAAFLYHLIILDFAARQQNHAADRIGEKRRAGGTRLK